MHRVNRDADRPGANGGRYGPSPPPPLDVAALLVDGARRRVFQAVRRARRPVTRDEVAASAHVSRSLAAFHLDKLVRSGLLRAGFQAPPASSVGRRPKVYESGPVEVHLDIPARQHGLLARVLVEALSREDDAVRVRRRATDVARRRGLDIGRAARVHPESADVQAVLEHLGFEPYEAGPSVVRLGNCPFQPIAAESTEVVCGLNLALVTGVIEGLGEADGLAPVLAPRPGECCVEIRLPPPGGASRSGRDG